MADTERGFLRVIAPLCGRQSRRVGARVPLSTESDRFPLLLYFPGWGATAVDNIPLIKRLAGAGFVVSAVHYPAALPAVPASVIANQRAELERPMDFSSASGFAETIERAEQRVRSRASDAVAILDWIYRSVPSDTNWWLFGRLDLKRVGIFGFSLGGAVAAEACVTDSRFRAAINLDGWHFGRALEQGVSQPYLFISDDSPLPTASDFVSRRPGRRNGARLNQKNHDLLISNLARHGGYLLTLAGSQHQDFADRRGRIELRHLLRRSRLAPSRVSEIVFQYVQSFFVEYLVGKKSAVLRRVVAIYPEVRLQSWPRVTVSPASSAATEAEDALFGCLGAAEIVRVPAAAPCDTTSGNQFSLPGRPDRK